MTVSALDLKQFINNGRVTVTPASKKDELSGPMAGLKLTGESYLLDNFEHYAKLRHVAYSEQTGGQDAALSEYLAELETTFNERYNASNEELEALKDDAKIEWCKGEGIDAPIVDGKCILTAEQMKNQELRKKLDTLTREYYPHVYAKPGTDKFSFISNSIRLVSENQTICFSVDTEQYEFDHDEIMEIGISVYDPRENLNTRTIPITRNYQLVVRESIGQRNRKHVCDYKDCYLLGESLVLSRKECVRFIQHLVNYYFICTTPEDRTWSRAILAHNASGDIHLLKDMGVKFPCPIDYDLKTLSSNSIYVLDTEKLHKWCYGEICCNLGRMLQLHRIPHSFLHNSGNDAHYTLQLLLALCDINHRRVYRLDDLKYMGDKIRTFLREIKESPGKVLPMSYAVAVLEHLDPAPAPPPAPAPQKPDKGKQKSDKGKKKNRRERKQRFRELLPQTEFHGMRAYDTAERAFLATLK
ncbi:Gfd2p KNAG_0C00440 [Huiozyma naganishii CBS 8797]|uniref:Gfd2/YDR514C-like C-terminal domain-containing protein n=1 Tax=Huiozyma naganishii (strain ATCC MYA-139 / BCRC 22969 / CBS 8797 / KCTC 17520 / NBRC 10181 / NCYC 3082 / Yp74L-3) TaxID=1071383 RepID=J7RHY5_HUIN7|nr:hypothetical protein KNAG_0C00440 [Kazachstania naganishii CBS 8797]CCK69158.1 hypothetical protein KNAG_0C00440 [Kazachstania naganishii CBS 8797]